MEMAWNPHFKEQNAKWHKSCYLKFGKSKLERAKEEKRKFNEEPTTSKRFFFTRSISGESYASTQMDSETLFVSSVPNQKLRKRNFTRSARFS